jgi:hypothetical protein
MLSALQVENLYRNQMFYCYLKNQKPKQNMNGYNTLPNPVITASYFMKNYDALQ